MLFCVRDRGCTPPVRGTRRRFRGAAAGGRRRRAAVVSGLSVAGGNAAVVLATPSSYGEIVAVDLATGAETVLTRHCAGQARGQPG